MLTHPLILGIGEALFDVLPDRTALGGAPLNVAVMANQLLLAHGGCATVVSRIGQDDLGRQMTSQLTDRGLSVELLQSDPDRPTGQVVVDLSDPASPVFDIEKGVAWDVIQFDPDLEYAASQCQAVCFGSLAQRDAQSRNTIHRVLASAKRACRLFDVNLRQDYFNRSIIERSCNAASIVKLNEHELPTICDLLGFDVSDESPGQSVTDNAQRLREKLEVPAIVLTRGSRGTVLIDGHGCHEAAVPDYPHADHADGVGAGDACSAGLLVGQVLRLGPARSVELANHCGSFVASQPGATPTLPDQILDLVAS